MTRKGQIEAALDRAVKAVALQPADEPALLLTRRYARELDGDGLLQEFGAGLRTMLIELGMTPRARASVLRGQAPPASGADALDELRAKREKRGA